MGQYLGEVHPTDRTRTASTYTDGDAERLLAGIQVTPCSRCSIPAFDPTSVQTNRGGLCETCFLADFRTELESEEEAERQKLVAQDCRMKNKGMAVRITASVHPDEGDDSQLTWYLKKKPLPDQIRVALLDEGSTVLDDFDIIEL